jgi:transcription elongation factor GreA
MARAHGDLAENAEYHAAKERQGQVEATIADLEDRLSRAMVIDPTTLSGDKVVFGATVTLTDEDKKKIRYQLVGQTEADAKVGRISYNSPLGRALIGRTVGEEVEVTTPSGERYYKIKAIEFV